MSVDEISGLDNLIDAIAEVMSDMLRSPSTDEREKVLAYLAKQYSIAAKMRDDTVKVMNDR